MPSVSLIIPVFNGSPYIERTIDCIKKQVWTDFEAIIVNDGSTDDTMTKCESLLQGDYRIRILSQSNQGASAARNTGINSAQGEYICFADADDFFNENYLSDLISSVQDSDLVIQGRIRVQQAEYRKIGILKEGIFNLDTSPSNFFSTIDIEKYGAPYCKLFRRQILNEYYIRYSTDIVLAEDFDFFIRYLSHCHKVSLTNHTNYYYYDNLGSLSKQLGTFEIEYKGLRQIDSSFRSLMNVFDLPELRTIYGRSIAYHTYRNIFSIYTRISLRKDRCARLEQLFVQYGEIYGKNRHPNTVFLRLLKFLFCHKCFRVMDFILYNHLCR